VHWLVPLAPPRLLAATGMIDTGDTFGPSVYGDPDDDTLSNQFAAMPSLHVGWALAVAVTLVVAHRGRWRWLWLGYPVLTLAVVVVTANHYWLDAAVGVAMLGVIIAVAPAPWRESGRLDRSGVIDGRRRPQLHHDLLGVERVERVLQLARVVAARGSRREQRGSLSIDDP
jgi:PAP2 superfamily